MTPPVVATATATAALSSRFTPAPGASPRARMLRAQTVMELRMLLRNGEQVGLTLVAPLLLLFFFNLPLLYSLGTRRIDFVAPGIIALSVMSSSFTGLAIGTGFERKYGVLKRLGSTALPRTTLLLGKTLSVLLLEVGQIVLISAAAFALGWHPHGNPVRVVFISVLLVLLGTAALGGLGLLLAGSVPAEVTLAAANLAWLVLLFCGGIAVPLSKFPAGLADVLRLLPSAALSDGLHEVLQNGSTFPVRPVLTLGVWAALAMPAAPRWFRWE